MTGTRPLALLITPVVPQPGHSGRALRAWDWVQTLARDHDVHVLLADPEAAEPMPLPSAPIRAMWRLKVARAPRLARAGALAVPLLVRSQPHLATDWVIPASGFLPEGLDALLKVRPTAKIAVFRLYLHDVGQAVARATSADAIEMDLDDLESATRRSVAGAWLRVRRPLMALRTLAGSLQYRQLEKRLQGYSRLWLAVAEDLPALPPAVREHTGVRPNRFATAGIPARVPPASPARLLFVGTLDYPPNQEAACFLAVRLLPALRRAGLDCRLTIAGRHAPPFLRKLAAQVANLSLVEGAELLDPVYRQSTAVLAPLRAGGGSKLKVLEAFAHARPLIASRCAMRGFGAVAGEHYLPAESLSDHVAAIRRLIDDSDMAQRLGTAGHAFCRNNFSLRECSAGAASAR